jgi:hypothetical protein
MRIDSRRKLVSFSLPLFVVAYGLLVGCGGATSPGSSTGTHTVDCTGGTSTTRVPIGDLGAGCYLSFQGGLYPDGGDSVPAAHRAAGLSAAARIQPLDVSGKPSATGKYVLLSIGYSNATQEFCSEGGQPGTCLSFSFIGQAAADPVVNHSTLVIVNGAAGGKADDFWTSPTLPDYDRIRDTWLTPLGLSERQVQVAWVKVANPQPQVSLPDSAADAYRVEQQIGQIARALKTRYPNLQQVFFSSRIYAGYATSNLNPEPYAYESGFGVKWAVQAQIDEMAGHGTTVRTGSLRYDNGTAPWIAWGPYFWAAGTQPRSDGLTWVQSDFNPSDGTHPATGARQKVGAMLLSFFKSSAETQCWFVAGHTCR